MAETKRKTPTAKELATPKKVSLMRQPGKAGRMRKKLFREMCMLGGALALMGVGQYFLSDWEGTHQQDRDKINSAVKQLTNDTTNMRRQIAVGTRELPAYNALFKDPAKPEIPLDRQQAAQTIQNLKDEYLLAALRVSMSPVGDLGTKQEPRFKNKFAYAQSVDVELNIDALSDEHVLNFLNRLRTVLPGKIKIMSLNFTKIAEPNTQMLALILQSGRVGLVRANVKLRWMGIKTSATPVQAGRPRQGSGGT